MKRMMIIILTLAMVSAVSVSAGNLPTTQVSKILEHKSALGLTEAQVKKLEQINKNAVEKMVEAKGQANIRLQEIEKFTSNWTSMNGTVYKSAEVNAILQARAILKNEQLTKYQQLASIDALMIYMENALASN
jgi:23S rRNA maturation mini-RNase III